MRDPEAAITPVRLILIAALGTGMLACFAGMAVVGDLRANLAPFLALYFVAYAAYGVAVWRLATRATRSRLICLIAGLALVIVGSAMVLFFAPKGGPKKPGHAKAAPTKPEKPAADETPVEKPQQPADEDEPEAEAHGGAEKPDKGPDVVAAGKPADTDESGDTESNEEVKENTES